MKRIVNDEISLASVSRESTEALYPLFLEDIVELNKWFGFDVDYTIQNDYQYLNSRKPPYNDAIIIFYHNKPCGRFGLYDYNSEDNSIFVYYWVSSHFRRKGIASAAMKTILEYLRELQVKEALFDVDKENLSSIKLLEKYPNMHIKAAEKHLIYSCLL